MNICYWSLIYKLGIFHTDKHWIDEFDPAGEGGWHKTINAMNAPWTNGTDFWKKLFDHFKIFYLKIILLFTYTLKYFSMFIPSEDSWQMITWEKE